jgi:TRAP-type C4-dicarboxylate transport system permease small subunit
LRALRAVDRAVGLAEQAVLIALLLALVGVGAFQTIGRNVFDSSPLWSYDLVQYLVFSIALIGAALSAHTGQVIRMDVVTRSLSPRGRAIARLATGAFTIAICGVLIHASFHLRTVLMDEKDFHLIRPSLGVLVLPVGAGLIAFHIAVQLAGFATALARGETVDEPHAAIMH